MQNMPTQVNNSLAFNLPKFSQQLQVLMHWPPSQPPATRYSTQGHKYYFVTMNVSFQLLLIFLLSSKYCCFSIFTNLLQSVLQIIKHLSPPWTSILHTEMHTNTPMYTHTHILTHSFTTQVFCPNSCCRNGDRNNCYCHFLLLKICSKFNCKSI